MNALVGDKQQLVLNAFVDWQPMELPQYVTDVVAFSSSEPGRRILHTLKLTNQILGQAIKKRVTKVYIAYTHAL